MHLFFAWHSLTIRAAVPCRFNLVVLGSFIAFVSKMYDDTYVYIVVVQFMYPLLSLNRISRSMTFLALLDYVMSMSRPFRFLKACIS